MTPLQHQLAQRLRRAAADTGGRRVVYRMEHLGYLPFGLYHWVTVGGKDVSLTCPDGWEWRDLEALADAGALVRVSQWVNPQDDLERESQYDVAVGDAGPEVAPDGAGRSGR
jgi:hypothetical protein